MAWLSYRYKFINSSVVYLPIYTKGMVQERYDYGKLSRTDVKKPQSNYLNPLSTLEKEKSIETVVGI